MSEIIKFPSLENESIKHNWFDAAEYLPDPGRGILLYFLSPEEEYVIIGSHEDIIFESMDTKIYWTNIPDLPRNGI